jgi:hypothetical protein
MRDMVKERIGDSAPLAGHYRVKSSMEVAADRDELELPEAYRPCKGTWAEFKGDVRSFFQKIRAEIGDRIDNAREAFRKLRRRTEPSPSETTRTR